MCHAWLQVANDDINHVRPLCSNVPTHLTPCMHLHVLGVHPLNGACANLLSAAGLHAGSR